MGFSPNFIAQFSRRHSVVLGMTRSGKTFFTGRILEELQAMRTHTIFVDPKHDDGYAHLGEICHSAIEVYEALLRKKNAIVFRPPATAEERVAELDRMVELVFQLSRTDGFKRMRRVIAIDEIQLFVKKGGSKAVEMIWTVGAGLGILGMALTQRIQLLNETIWSQSDNKVIFKIEDRHDYLKSRNLEHYVEKTDFFLDPMNKYFFYYTQGGGHWHTSEPVPKRKQTGELNLSRW